MSIVEIHSVASHRYYMRKSKREIRQRIMDMARLLKFPFVGETDLRLQMEPMSKDALASLAMRYHMEFPE